MNISSSQPLKHLLLILARRDFFKGVFTFNIPVKPDAFNHR